MKSNFLKSGAVLSLSALLLAACGPQNGAVTPNPDALTAPAAPVVGQATDLQNVPATLDRASGTLRDMFNPANPDFDPDLAAVLAVLGGGAVPGASATPLNLGRDLARALPQRGNTRPLAITVNPVAQRSPLPTGTYTLNTAGGVSYSQEPTTGYVVKNLRAGTTLTVDWRVGGAQTVWAEFTQGGTRVNQEVPTRAAATLTKGNSKLAAAQFSLTPGACLGTTGPEALSLNAWAGREQNAPAALNLQYAWTDTAITLKASASLQTRTRSAETALDLNVRGTTANRCTPATLAFTPTRADVTASAKVPGDEAKATLNLRKLSGVVISGAELRATSPFARVTGDLGASVTHNGRPLLTAFGPLADGPDADPFPGDAVVVRYVEGGKLVETNLAAALKKLFP